MSRESGLRTSAAKVTAPRDSRAKVENLMIAIWVLMWSIRDRTRQGFHRN